MLTEEQSAIVDSQDDDAQSIIAYAGTGKTFTLARYAEARPHSRFLYLAYNKSVREAAEAAFPSNTYCSTIHSLAYSAMRIRGQLSGFISFFSVAKLLRISLPEAVDVVDTVEVFMRSAHPKITADVVPFRFEAEQDEAIRDVIAERAQKVFDALRTGQLDMTHNCYLKLYQLSQPKLKQDAILLDEAQDANPLMLDILNQQLDAKRCRVVAVGDPFQQIYAFNGAVDAMDNLRGARYFLTKSWRFGDNLADMATEFLNRFYPIEHPLVGNDRVYTECINPEAEGEPVTLPFPYTHLFRGNASLFREAHALAQRGTKIALTGGDSFNGFMAELLDLLQAHQGRSEKCKNPLARIFAPWEELKAWATRRGDTQLASKMDIVETYSTTLPSVVERIQSRLVSDEDAEVLLVTAHRAKGREWRRVRIANDFPFLTDEVGTPLEPSKKPVKGDDVFRSIDSNEINLLYVAMTRGIEQVALNGAVHGLFRGEPNEYLLRLRERMNAGRVSKDDVGDDDDAEGEY
jgi:superfamily I DNA/RNA helicase